MNYIYDAMSTNALHESIAEHRRSINDIYEMHINPITQRVDYLYSEMKKLDARDPKQREMKDKMYNEIQYAKAVRHDHYKDIEYHKREIEEIKFILSNRSGRR